MIVRAALIGMLFVLLPALAHADIVWRKGGRKLEGKVIKEEKDRVLVRVRVGQIESEIWIPTKDIERIERGELPMDEFQQRLDALDPADLEGHKKLEAWATSKRLQDAKILIARLLPEVERLSKIKKNPRLWCRTCEARGEYACPRCEGRGKLLDACLRCAGEKTIRCRTCGHRGDEGDLRCKKCSGVGKIERFNPAKGKKEKAKCPLCRGKGVHQCPTCEGKQKQRCPACKGVGGVDKTCPKCDDNPIGPCPTCHGSGLQKTPLTDAELAAEKKALEDAAKKAAAAEAGESAEKPTPQPTSKPSQS